MRRHRDPPPSIDRIRARVAEGTRAEDWLRTWLPSPATSAYPLNAALEGALQAAGWAEAAEALAHEYVALAREHGATWTEVGQLLGITRQAAQQRYAAPGQNHAREAER